MFYLFLHRMNQRESLASHHAEVNDSLRSFPIVSSLDESFGNKRLLTTLKIGLITASIMIMLTIFAQFMDVRRCYRIVSKSELFTF